MEGGQSRGKVEREERQEQGELMEENEVRVSGRRDKDRTRALGITQGRLGVLNERLKISRRKESEDKATRGNKQNREGKTYASTG